MNADLAADNTANAGNPSVSLSRGQLLLGHALSFVGIGLCGVVAADLVWTGLYGPTLAPPAPAQSASTARQAARLKPDTSILGAFDPFFRAVDAPSVTAPSQQEAAPETSLNIKLYGVRAAGTASQGATGLGSAIIEDPKGVQSSFAVGDDIILGVTLVAVYADYVEISRGGVRESLFFPGGRRELKGIAPLDAAPLDAAAASAARNRFAQPPKVKTKASAKAKAKPRGLSARQIDQLIKSTSLTPFVQDGVTYGFTIQPRGGDLLLRRLGLRPGDLLVEVAGTSLDSTTRAAQLADLLKKNANVELVIERGGVRQTLNFSYSEAPNDDV